MASTVLVVGATRGLGAALAKAYAAQPATTVFATTRAQTAPSAPAGPNIHWIPSVDISSPTAGPTLASHLRNHGKQVQLDVTIITAGYFGTETFDAPDWDKEVKMYVTSAIGPVFVVQALVKAGLVREAAGVGGKGGDGGAGAGRVVLVTSESGSVALRHESEGGGNYGHHASKAAGNMVGRLLSLDLRDRGIAVVSVHVSRRVARGASWRDDWLTGTDSRASCGRR